tara:strand:+ start:291 stop:521 length:231 start_codon:yes stop_codon:yes gene_type:complete
MKAIVLTLRGGGNDKCDIIAAIRGTWRSDMKFLSVYVGAQKSHFAKLSEANNVTGCVSGAVPPFTFRKELILIFVS